MGKCDPVFFILALCWPTSPPWPDVTLWRTWPESLPTGWLGPDLSQEHFLCSNWWACPCPSLHQLAPWIHEAHSTGCTW
jgi:hypothetical protein